MTDKLHKELVNLAVEIIDRHVIKEEQHELQTDQHGVDSVINWFNSKYRNNLELPDYIAFDSCGEKGIPWLVQYFTTFDPVNEVGPFGVWSDFTISPNFLEMQHVQRYMSAPEFNKGLLTSTRYDRVVHAIFSYILPWTTEALLEFGETYPQLKVLANGLVMERTRSPVYVSTNEKRVLFVRSSFRMLTQYFNTTECYKSMLVTQKSQRPIFNIYKYVPFSWVEHFEDVYKSLLNESMNQQEISILEAPIVSPFLKAALNYSGANYYINDTVKVITGQACCGKTTLLESLKDHGWTICSRGDLGTFSGKAKSPPAVAGLHAAIDNALHRGDTLGDRGAIDNPLWWIIMSLCDPQYKDRVVQELMNFFNGTINEHVFTYMFRQKVVVFIDPYPSLNRARMLRRCTNGDAFRARIYMYPITQCIAYYIAARLYGWTVRCVPYNEKREFQPQRYEAVAKEIIGLFGSPISQLPLEVASRPNGCYLEDKEYSVATGIFK